MSVVFWWSYLTNKSDDDLKGSEHEVVHCAKGKTNVLYFVPQFNPIHTYKTAANPQPFLRLLPPLRVVLEKDLGFMTDWSSTLASSWGRGDFGLKGRNTKLCLSCLQLFWLRSCLLIFCFFLFVAYYNLLSLSLSLSLHPSRSQHAQILTLSLRDGGKVPAILYRKYELMDEVVFNILAYSLVTLLRYTDDMLVAKVRKSFTKFARYMRVAATGDVDRLAATLFWRLQKKPA